MCYTQAKNSTNAKEGAIQSGATDASNAGSGSTTTSQKKKRRCNCGNGLLLASNWDHSFDPDADEKWVGRIFRACNSQNS